MKIYHGLSDLPVLHNTVLTIGSFDGVHPGAGFVVNKTSGDERCSSGSPTAAPAYAITATRSQGGDGKRPPRPRTRSGLVGSDIAGRGVASAAQGPSGSLEDPKVSAVGWCRSLVRRVLASRTPFACYLRAALSIT